MCVNNVNSVIDVIINKEVINMAIKIKVPVSKIQKNDVQERVRETLSSDPNNAYTVMGLMVERFGVKKEDIDGKPFNQWKSGQPSMYTRIRTSLEKLKKEGKINSTKHGRAEVYWWKK